MKPGVPALGWHASGLKIMHLSAAGTIQILQDFIP